MDIFDLQAKITLDDSKYTRSIEKMSKGTSKLSSLLTTGLKAGAAAAGTAITAAGGAVVALGKKALDSYGEYEQLVGGVETLFKESAPQVVQYASEAYKTAQISANNYMDTITSFSASMLAALDGNTAKTAEASNQAIIDMSDNANKMGTAMESIQNAYQGFAKQNYTMLSNLKLGYGRTKEEMQRLIDDANNLNAAQGKATNYSIDSFADITAAIHDVQTELGITGTSAKEASTTIQGSMNMLKSSWDNLITGLGDPNADIEELVNNVIDSAEAVSKNVVPLLERVIPSVTEALPEMINTLVPEVAKLITDTAPDLADSAVELVKSLVKTIKENGEEFSNTAIEIIDIIIQGIIEILPDLIETVISMLVSIIEAVIKWIDEHGDEVIDKIGEVLKLVVDKISELKDKIVDKVSEQIDAVKEKINKKKKEITNAVKTLASNAVTAAGNKFSEIKNKITKPFSDALTKIKNIMAKIKSTVSGIKLSLPHIKLPHFSVSGGEAPYGIGGKGSLPKMSVKWYAQGGVVNRPTLFGYGEAGAEAIVPLERNTYWLSRMSDMVAERLNATGEVYAPNITVNVNGGQYPDGDALANAIAIKLQQQYRKKAGAF